ncbi:WGR domain-containing protein [Croceicoccus naphthovorans]|uniref:WGR domain-containing protein n=1 Tax=Croceicoccus naphthovorans TaxID=1348774 RepID=UPI0009DFDBA2|nr:WGR domain-containing protein [Croceicoccus naphthovorans]
MGPLVASQIAWGRIGSRGQGRAVSFASEDEASRFTRRLLRHRSSAPKRIDVAYREVSF